MDFKRPTKRTTDIAHHTIWDSRDGCYRVVLWESPLGGDDGYPAKYYAYKMVPTQREIGEHRTKAAAIRTCEQHERSLNV